MKVITHTICGGKLGDYNDDNLTGKPRDSSKFIRVDGTSPKRKEKLCEKCPVCGRNVTSWKEIEVEQVKDDDTWN
jgi:hypothetical protein